MPEKPLTRRLAGYSAAAGAAIAMSTLALFVRHVTVPTETIVFARFLVGACLFFLGVLISGRISKLRGSVSLPLLIISLVGPLIVFTYVQAMRHTSAANAAFLLYLGPALAVALAGPILREEISLRNIGLLAVSLGGTGLLVSSEIRLEGKDPTWIFWGLCSAALFATYMLASRRIPEETPTEARTLWQLGLGAFIALLFVVPQIKHEGLLGIPPAEIPWLLGIGLVTGALAIMLITMSLRDLPAAKYAVIAYLEPVSAAVLGFAFLSEKLEFIQLLGGSMVVAAGVLQAVGELRES